jgi:hypothetical protein
MTPTKATSVTCVLLAFTALIAVPVHAAVMPVTFSGSSGSLSASAKFALVDGNLQITLTNTSSADVMVPTDVLTAVFFNLVPQATLTRISAVLADGSTVLFGSADAGGVVGGEWAYKSGLSGAPGNAGLGVSSSGLDLFGPHDVFPGSNLQGPDSPDGIQYGITSAGDISTTGNSAVTGSNALIKNSVVFTFGVPSDFDPTTSITGVQFQYGTCLGEVPPIPGTIPPSGDPSTPEPATFVIWSLLFGSGFLVWRRRGT